MGAPAGGKSKKAKGKHRLDKFYHLAKEQGYRSRAAFKLIQLNRKYDFLAKSRTLVDLCAAPGGWCQVATKNMPVGSLIVAVDLVPIKPIRGVKTLIGDITTQNCRAEIRREAKGLVDTVLCDGAPNVGGAWQTEAYTQSWIALEALKLATDVLAPKGTFVTKVFRSKDYSALMYAFNQLFTRVEATKPAASRNASAEIFVVCLGYKAPSRIDPRLLDAKHLFQEVAEAPKQGGPDALLKTKAKQRRHREGYEDGVSSTHRALSAAAFLHSDAPVDLLGQCTAIALEGPAAAAPVAGLGEELAGLAALIAGHPATSAEVRLLCTDLQVLGRSEFKQLLKWRLTLKRDLTKEMARIAAAEAAGSGSDGEAGGDGAGKEGSEEDEDEEDEEARLLREMGEMKARIDRRRHRERKRRKELKNKARQRAVQLAAAEGIGEDLGPESLFSLAGIKGKAAVAAVGEAAAPESDADAGSSSDGGSGPSDGSDLDSEEEQRRYDAVMDAYLEESYRSYKQRQRMRDSAGGVPKKKRRRLGMDGELSDEEDGGGVDLPDLPSSDGEEEEEGGGLIVSLDERRAGVPATASAAAAQWFAQDIFDDANLEEEEEEEEEPAQRPAKRAATAKGRAPAAAAAAEEEEEEEEEEEAPRADDAAMLGYHSSGSDGERPTKPRKVTGGGGAGGGASNGAGFEVVPLAGSDSDLSDSEDEFEGMDDNAKAEILALGKKMLRRKVKDDIVEAAYNRYAFHDTGLPKWFMEDERRHMRPAPQITGAEYKAAKEELRAIDARPIKKVVEAKARKQKRLVAKLTQARQKAESIANQEDVPMKSKMREIEKVYAKARAAGKGARRGGKKGGGTSRADQYKSKGPPLDPRLRKDKKGLERAAKKAKARGGGKAGGKGGGKRGGKR